MPHALAKRLTAFPRFMSDTVLELGCFCKIGRKVILSDNHVVTFMEAIESPLKVLKRSKLYSYRGKVASRRLRGPTGTADKKIAERIAALTKTKAWQSHLDGSGETLRFAQAAIADRQAARDDRFLDRVEDYWKETLVPKSQAKLSAKWPVHCILARPTSLWTTKASYRRKRSSTTQRIWNDAHGSG